MPKFLSLLTIVITITVILAQPTAVFANLQDDYNRIKSTQQRLKGQIDDQKSQERTLAGDMAAMDDQISQTESQIGDMKAKLAQTVTEITNAITALNRLDQHIVQTQDIADERARELYKTKRTPSFGAVIAAKNFNRAILSAQYSKDLEQNDKKIIEQLAADRQDVRTQKARLDQNRQEQQSLSAQLESKRQDLDQAKANKANLLAETQNNEAIYQRQLAEEDAELQGILAALNGAKVRLGRVRRGDIIAREGATGCATGSHLHFGYRLSPSSSWINPAPYLRSGALGKPESGYPNNVTQNFGDNAVPGAYGSAGHDAIDMQDGYGSPIFAAKDGVAYAATDGGCPALGIGTRTGHGIIIDHDDGTQTLYWHIQG